MKVPVKKYRLLAKLGGERLLAELAAQKGVRMTINREVIGEPVGSGSYSDLRTLYLPPLWWIEFSGPIDQKGLKHVAAQFGALSCSKAEPVFDCFENVIAFGLFVLLECL